MITATQAQQYLDQTLGISVPAFVLASAVDKVEAVEAAMIDAGYSDSDQTLIQCMAVALISAPGDPRRVQSQGAPSGASRSFKYANADLTALRRSLMALDTAGTVTALIGPDPVNNTMFLVTC